MNQIIKKIEDEQLREVAQFNIGDTVRVHNKIKEGNRERVQVFEGIVIKRQGGGNRETFTVRKNSNGVGYRHTALPGRLDAPAHPRVGRLQPDHGLHPQRSMVPGQGVLHHLHLLLDPLVIPPRAHRPDARSGVALSDAHRPG